MTLSTLATDVAGFFIGISSIAVTIKETVTNLEEYLKGGQDSEHKQLREGYGHILKPQARKIKEYLQGILEDVQKYKYDKRPGRRKSKNIDR